MPKKECPSCAMKIESSCRVCPICGYEFARNSPVITWTAILLVIIFLMTLVVGLTRFL